MRCQIIRSVLRASFVAGLIASCQNAVLSASWKDCLQPFAGTCFIHDLQWEQFNSKSIRKFDSEIIQTSDKETDLCVAAAEQFEFNSKVDAAFEALRSKSSQFFQSGAMLFQSYSRSRRIVISSIDSLSLRLVDWIKVANAFPPMAGETQGNQDFECGWDCEEWNRVIPHSVSRISAYRGCANVFVYSLDSSENVPTDSNFDPSVLDTDHASLVGVELACPEDQLIDHGWNGSLVQPSICCPQEADPEAICREHYTVQSAILVRPPTLEAEYEAQAADTSFEFAELIAIENINLDIVSEPNGIPFSSKDFLTTLHASTYGPIILPASNSHRLAVDYAMKVISQPSTEARSQMSMRVAGQIRTVGQFLVDFANQIDNRIEQVEIARRDNVQR